MSTAQAASALAADARSLDQLRSTAKSDPQGALRQAAAQFETVFMNMLLKSMRDALPHEDPLASEASRTYTGMLDQQMAQGLSGKGLGLAELMVKQLSRNQTAPAANGAAEQGLLKKLDAATKGAGSEAQAGGAAGGAREFVRRNLDHAIEAQKSSGIPAHYILGQAALESGWGKHEIRGADGKGTHNLFGIKAGPGWKGATADVLTTEYINGTPRKVVEKFRAYDSYAAAFQDYAKLLSGNPRYAKAIEQSSDVAQFARQIQSAGYATDPNYAQKLTRVINQTLSMRGVA
jgi:peptidoglycan hydrolase FlgJ